MLLKLDGVYDSVNYYASANMRQPSILEMFAIRV